MNYFRAKGSLAFLDDLYVTTTKGRPCEAFKTVASCVERHAGVKSHLGKLKAWSKGGDEAPTELEALRPTDEDSVWQADKPDELNGLVVLGIPLGKDAFVQAFATKRLETEQKLLEELPKLSDLQHAWVLLSQSAVPRANHTIRILPPSQSKFYASRHDAALWESFCQVFGAGVLTNDGLAKQVATLLGRLRGLGLRSAERTAAAAFWASWASALPALANKSPRLCNAVLSELANDNTVVDCLTEVKANFAE